MMKRVLYRVIWTAVCVILLIAPSALANTQTEEFLRGRWVLSEETKDAYHIVGSSENQWPTYEFEMTGNGLELTCRWMGFFTAKAAYRIGEDSIDVVFTAGQSPWQGEESITLSISGTDMQQETILGTFRYVKEGGQHVAWTPPDDSAMLGQLQGGRPTAEPAGEAEAPVFPLDIQAVPVQYLEDGLCVAWNEIEGAQIYRVHIESENSPFTLTCQLYAKNKPEYSMTIGQEELSGRGGYILSVTAEKDNQILEQSREVLVSMQVAKNFDDAICLDPAEADQSFLELASAYMVVAAYDKDEVQTCLSNLGFRDIQSFNYHDQLRKEDDHLVAYSFAYKDIMVEQVKTRVFAVIVRGTTGQNEWVSNFKVGTGDESEGFARAARECRQRFDAYRNAFSPGAETPAKIWLAGHSRGAAVCNLMSAWYLQDGVFQEADMHAHLFACPRVTMKECAITTLSIRNYNCSEDLVTRVPPVEWGYGSHGTDYVYQTWRHDEGLHRLNLFLNAAFQLIPSKEAYNENYSKLMKTEFANVIINLYCNTLSPDKINWVKLFGEAAAAKIKSELGEITGLSTLQTIRNLFNLPDYEMLGVTAAAYFPYMDSHSSRNYRVIAVNRIIDRKGYEYYLDVYRTVYSQD